MVKTKNSTKTKPKKTTTKKKDPSIVFLLAGALFDYHIETVKVIRKRFPKAKISAFVCARHNLLTRIKQLDGTPYAFNRYDFLNDMTTTWINTPVDYKKLDKYRDMLGDDTLRKIITADREIGYGYVVGGYVEQTKLTDFFKKNPERRWSYVIGLLDYCFDLIKDQKPDVIYTYGVAGADAIALHFAAQYHKIPAVQLTYARYDDDYIIDPDEAIRMPDVKSLYEKAKKNKDILSKDAIYRANTHIDNFLQKPERPIDTVFWVDKIKKDNSVFGFLKTLSIDIARWGAIRAGLIGTRGIWRQRYGWEITKLTILKFIHIRKFLWSKQKSLDELTNGRPFIYFPLHIDPEMTTMVVADKLTDQLSVIEHISKQMPVGWKLVVKDHIPMIGKRPAHFYDRLKNMPDVCVVSPFEDNFKCMKQAKVTITLTGTAGWESMLLGKVPVVMGYPHYLNLGEGVVHCTEPTKLGEAIQTALKTKPISISKLKTYTACMLSNSFDLPISYLWFKEKQSAERIEKSIENLAERLLAYSK